MAKRKGDQYWGAKSHVRGSGARIDPYKALAAGVMVQAAREAQGGDLGACEWLTSEFASVFCDAVEFDHTRIQKTARRWMTAPAGKLIVRIAI